MASYHTKNNRTSQRGAFINQIWHCDCDPRMPADKFQTKNGGKNHGRWFYTCQKAQPKRCGFFLWADDAKVREESAVLSNSRSEPQPIPVVVQAPQTPRKTTLLQTATPDSRSKLMSARKPAERSPTQSPTKQPLSNQGKEEDFDWSSSNDEELASAVDTFETPRKTPRTGIITSPTKRYHTTMNESDDVFTTPSTSKRNGLLSPKATPARPHTHNPRTSDLAPDSLASEALIILSSTSLPTSTKDNLVELLNKFELKAQGISKGRDLTRLALQEKDKKIAELQSRIQGLEQERETTKNVISLLKSDMATSPKRGPRRPRVQGEGGKSEV